MSTLPYWLNQLHDLVVGKIWNAFSAPGIYFIIHITIGVENRATNNYR
jgi:hypothetical protein